MRSASSKVPLEVEKIQVNQQNRPRQKENEYYKLQYLNLESENQILQEDIMIANQKVRDSTFSDSKMDSFVKENSSLHLDNEKLVKLVKQKKTEADLWKSKYKTQMQQIIQIKANYEQEIRQLSSEVQSLHAKIDEFEFDKQRQVLDQKSTIQNQASKDIDYVKKASHQQSEMMELQIRKLKDQIEDNELEIEDLQEKLFRQKSEDDKEKERFLKENENLRIKMNQLEVDKQRELEELNDAINRFTLEQIENLKQEFSGHNDIMEGEIEKLKGLLEIKNAEIDTLVQQNQRSKFNFEADIKLFKDETALLKTKLLDSERSSRISLEALQKEMHLLLEQRLNDLKSNYESLFLNFEKEISDLKNMIKKKDLELQNYQSEKQQQRAYFEGITSELKRELEVTQIQYLETQKEKNIEIEELQEQFRKSQSFMSEQNENLKSEVLFLEGEISQLKEQLILKVHELESLVQQFSLQKRGFEDDSRKANFQIEQTTADFISLQYQKNQEIEEIRTRNQKIEGQLREKMKQLEILNEQYDLEIKRQKEFADIRNQEYENILCQKQLVEKDLKRSRDDFEATKIRLLQGERDKNVQLEDLKKKLEESNLFQINNLKAAFNTQIQVLNDENLQLKQNLEQRKLDIQDLLEKYEKLRQLENSQLTPELITNNNIYDIYLKSRYKQTNEKLNEY